MEGISKQFPGVLALDNVSLDVRAGEVHAIVGENGAGKSTLMKILSGVETEYEGRLFLRGTPCRFHGPRDAERAGVSIIHQELNLVECLSAAANIFLGREMSHLGFLTGKAMNAAAAQWLDALECRARPDQVVGELRVGDQQLVEIAKALSLSADVLIMDEPTSALTAAESERLFRVIETLLTRGVTVVYISHKLDEVFRLAHRITVLRDGRLIQTFEAPEATPRLVMQRMVGREIQKAPARRLESSQQELLRVEELSLPWPGHARRWRLRNISFTLFEGEILGIAGLMGAGRTELLECLFGASADRPTGRIVLDGRPAQFRHPREALRAGIAFVTEDRKRLGLFSQMTVGQNITLCQLREATQWGFVEAGREARMAREVIDRLGVKTPGPGSAITGLSGGNQQKALVGRSLLTRPRLLLLDDPTRGVDVGAKAELYDLIRQECDRGRGIIVTSSELPELLTLCDRILVLAEGELTGEFTREEATEEKIMAAATRGVVRDS
jgi:ABC-type sugar transport system ATPase subunit